jgi:hypothetical protein
MTNVDWTQVAKRNKKIISINAKREKKKIVQSKSNVFLLHRELSLLFTVQEQQAAPVDARPQLMSISCRSICCQSDSADAYLSSSISIQSMDVISGIRRFYSDKGARTGGSEEEKNFLGI